MPDAKPAPAVTKPARRGSAIDTLVARDRTAVFWFLVACAVGVACAWYVQLMTNVFKQRPPFVVMDTSGAYYVPPGVQYINMDAMHVHLTEMMAETLLERGPEGLRYPDRLPKLCLEDALRQIRKTLLQEGDFFVRQKVEQHVEIEDTKLLRRTSSQMESRVTGKVLRNSFFSGKEQSETYSFVLTTVWKENTNILVNKAFPSRLKDYKLTLTKISDS